MRCRELTEYYGRGRGYICRVAESLSGNDGDLNAETYTGAHDGLVPEVLSRRGIDIQGIDECSADNAEDAASGKEGLAVSR